MMFHRLGLIHHKQKGFTAIELLVAIAVAGIITGGITTAVFQIVTGNVRTSNHMTAIRQVQEAGYWVSHDTQMSETVSTNTTAATGFPLTLNWVDFNDSSYDLVYDLIDMSGGLKALQRSYSVNGTIQDNSIVARYIDDSSPAQASCNFTAGELTFTVTATVGSGSEQQSETRVYRIRPRPDS